MVQEGTIIREETAHVYNWNRDDCHTPGRQNEGSSHNMLFAPSLPTHPLYDSFECMRSSTKAILQLSSFLSTLILITRFVSQLVGQNKLYS